MNVPNQINAAGNQTSAMSAKTYDFVVQYLTPKDLLSLSFSIIERKFLKFIKEIPTDLGLNKAGNVTSPSSTR